jgi:hypothetical protein
MTEQLTKLRPDRDLQCYFERPSAVAALSDTSPTGFTVSGVFRQQFDWAVLEWNRDNVFEHPALRPLPDGNLHGLRLAYDEERDNCMLWDCTLWPTVDWPYLRVWATGQDGVEREYKVPITGTPLGAYAEAAATFTISGEPATGECLELAWESDDGVPGWYRHATHSLYYDQKAKDGLQILAISINSATDQTGMSAEASDTQITLKYRADKGANGNRIGAYANPIGLGKATWDPVCQLLSGGVSPTKRHVEIDFGNLQGYVGPDFLNLATVPTTNVRKMRWTWAPPQSAGEFAAGEFRVLISNWTVSGTGAGYCVAGPGSWRVEDDAPQLTYSGAWDHSGRGNYSGGSIALTTQTGASVSHTYLSDRSHVLYLGTRRFRNASGAAAKIVIEADGVSRNEDLALAGIEDTLVRLPIANMEPGEHTVTVRQAGAGSFYFDFFEIAFPASGLPVFPACPETTLATDWDTDHCLALAPERTAWLIKTLGFQGRANHYAGAMWFYQMTRPGNQYASAQVTFSGAPKFGDFTRVRVGTAVFEHLNLFVDDAWSVTGALAMAINAGATAVRAEALGNTLRVVSRAMGTSGNGETIIAETTNDLTFEVDGPMRGGSDGDVTSLPWANGWRTDLQASPAINRAARDWHRSYCRALNEMGVPATAAFSMELQHGEPGEKAGIAQRYPDNSPVLLNTPAVQTNFSPESTAFWRRVYREMADLMVQAGVTPYLQFGEVQWWYFASASGMPFYDQYTRARFQAAYGKPIGTISSERSDPNAFLNEAALLPLLIGEFTEDVESFVRAAYPQAQFEVLYAPDVNDAPFTRVVNFPSAYWSPAHLACLKTENFTYTGNRDLNKISESVTFPFAYGFPQSKASHLIGIGEYTSPWEKERRLALALNGSVVLFALDQFCLIGYSLPLERSHRRACLLGSTDTD